MTRTVPAARETVFEAFTSAEVLRQWWGPAGFTVASLDYDPRAGASYRIEMQPPEGDAFFLVGEFREVDPPSRLVYTFVWEEPDPDDVDYLVELTFEDRGESTEVIFRQGTFKTEARRELHRDGWTDTFDKLERHLAH